MKISDERTKRAFVNVWFGNFYRPAFDDRAFVEWAIGFLESEGFTSIMLDAKAWEDFDERFRGGAASEYVSMQEFMEERIVAHGLSYDFLSLYLNADNLYPAIRFSPPIYGESIVRADGSDGRWYRYWSPKARASMEKHVAGLVESYGKGMTRVDFQGKIRRVIVSMWDPIVAPSFDDDGVKRYLSFLERKYGSIEKLNAAYKTYYSSFYGMKPSDWWFDERKKLFPSSKAGEKTILTEQEKRLLFDNRKWQSEELVDYFRDMSDRLHSVSDDLLLCPVLSQWGYFLTVDGAMLSKVGFADLWDTANRGIDVFCLKAFVDVVNFISVPVTPSGDPDCYVSGYHHSLMRIANRNRPFFGGIYFGRYLYNHIYDFLTPSEVIGTVVSSGACGYTSYGMCGLDDGGVLHRMERYFNEDLARGNAWLDRVLPILGERIASDVAILFPSEMALAESLCEHGAAERRLDSLGYYHALCDLGISADVVDKKDFTSNSSLYRVLVLPDNDLYELDRDFDFEASLRAFVEHGGMVIHSPGSGEADAVFGLSRRTHGAAPVELGEKCMVFSSSFVAYDDGEALCRYADGAIAVSLHTSKAGMIVSFGFDYGYSYVSKAVPHVPVSEKNNELYPLQMLRRNILGEILARVGLKPVFVRNIERTKFENGVVIVNHTSYPYMIEEVGERIFSCRVDDDTLLPHNTVFVRRK